MAEELNRYVINGGGALFGDGATIAAGVELLLNFGGLGGVGIA